MDIVIWIAFLIGAPAILYWLWKSNKQRRDRWREWCRSRGWRIDVDRDNGIEVQAGSRFPDFPIDARHMKRSSIDMRGHGPHRDTEAATWEWRMLTQYAGKMGHASATGNTLHAVALRLPAAAPSPLYLLPRPMTLLSMSGFLDQPEIDLGVIGSAEGWSCHAADEAGARAWLRTHLPRTDRKAVPDLVMLQLKGDWAVAWHLGETRPERIDAALQWLSNATTGDAPRA